MKQLPQPRHHRFVYRSLGDSTVILAGRELIELFEDTKDIIDFTHLTLTPAVFFAGVDAAFAQPLGSASMRVFRTS